MTEKKINPLFYILTILTIIYILTAVLPLSKELHFVAEWTVDASSVSANSEELQNSEKEQIPFKLGQTAGYFTRDGEICRIITFPYKATISDSIYSVYGTNGDAIPFYSNDGTQKGTINQPGFPFFQNDRMYIMKPGGASFAKLSDDGSELWSFENYAPITAFSSSEGGTVAGYADGTVISFDNDGNIDQEYSPGGSDYSVILGAAISKSGELIATVSGQERQRFVLTEKNHNISKIIFHEFFTDSTTRQMHVKFSYDENFIFYSFKDSLGILNCKTLKSSHIPIKGHILSIQQSDTTGTVFVLSKEAGLYTVSVIEPNDNYRGSFSFAAEHSFISVKGDDLFIGRDYKISKIKIVYK